jgi:hypothetical protein
VDLNTRALLSPPVASITNFAGGHDLRSLVFDPIDSILYIWSYPNSVIAVAVPNSALRHNNSMPRWQTPVPIVNALGGCPTPTFVLRLADRMLAKSLFVGCTDFVMFGQGISASVTHTRANASDYVSCVLDLNMLLVCLAFLCCL